MKTAINRLAIGLLVALPLLAETGCAQGPPVPVTADSIAMAEALSGGRKTIGVVALGPTQMMNDNWSDFDPAVRSWLAQGPTFSTLGKRGVRAPGGGRERTASGLQWYPALCRSLLSDCRDGSHAGRRTVWSGGRGDRLGG